ncbi:hypothetical protein ABQE42_10025, partial [Mycolicibacterium pulveris]
MAAGILAVPNTGSASSPPPPYPVKSLSSATAITPAAVIPPMTPNALAGAVVSGATRRSARIAELSEALAPLGFTAVLQPTADDEDANSAAGPSRPDSTALRDRAPAALIGTGGAPSPSGGAQTALLLPSPATIATDFISFFISDGDEPGENAGLLIGNGADGVAPGQAGGRGGL